MTADELNVTALLLEVRADVIEIKTKLEGCLPDIERHDERINKVEKDLAVLGVKAGMWGAITGMLTSAVAILLNHFR